MKKWLCPREKIFQWEKIFKIDIFVLKYVLNHSKSIPTKKKFSKNFRFFGHQFFEKMAKSQKKKFSMGKIFKIVIFVLKHVLSYSKSILTKKKFFEKFSIFWSPIFRKNGYVPEKNFQREKIFKIDIFVLKHVLDHSTSIPKKNFFFENFRFFSHQFFEKKNGYVPEKNSTGKNFQNRYFRSKTRFGPF